jgi:UDP-2,3-diacylglucosamine hydrolase
MSSDKAPASLPPFNELQAPASWQAVEFISDLHLSVHTPSTFESLRGYLVTTTADAVCILGDLFDAWIGDDARHDAFESQCVALLLGAARRIPFVGFMAGNRDFLVGPKMLQACGMKALPDPTVLSAFGQRVLLTHGDALCLADTEYLKFRSVARSDDWQLAALSQPLEARREQARALRAQSEYHKGQQGMDNWADVDAGAALHWLFGAHATVMVHGHTHRPGSEALSPGVTRHVLSDWDLDAEPSRAEVLRWTSAGFQRLPLQTAQA